MTRAAEQIRATALYTLPGKNYWSRRPVTRLDLAIGAFEEISSADVAGFTTRLVTALPGLHDHECPAGAPGGFVQCLARGTHAPHVIEHVALELQRMRGDDVRFGRTRGAERWAHYVVAFSHVHAAVGRAAAHAALAIVQRGLDQEPLGVRDELATLTRAADEPDEPAATHVVEAVICAPAERGRAIASALGRDAVCVTPTTLVERGLPFHEARVAIVPDATQASAPAGFRMDDRPDRVFSVLVDGLAEDGVLYCPAEADALRGYAERRGRRVTPLDARTARDLLSADASRRAPSR